MRIVPANNVNMCGKYQSTIEGLKEFSKISRIEQKILIENEEIRQAFNEIHPELNDEKSIITPLQKFVAEMVEHTRKLQKEWNSKFQSGIKHNG